MGLRAPLVCQRWAIGKAIVLPFWRRRKVILEEVNQEGEDDDVAPGVLNPPHGGEIGPYMLS